MAQAHKNPRQAPPTTPKRQPIKIWDNWSAGVGYVVDDGQTPGMSFAEGLLGLENELRVAPAFTSAVAAPVKPVLGFYADVDQSASAFAFVGASLAPSGGVAARVDSVVTASSTGTTTLTQSFTVSTTDVDIMVVAVNVRNNLAAPSSVTFAGFGMTKIADDNLTSPPTVSLWYRDSPVVTTDDVVVTHGSSVNMDVAIFDYENVNGADPIEDFGAATDTATDDVFVENGRTLCYAPSAATINGVVIGIASEVSATVLAKDREDTLVATLIAASSLVTEKSVASSGPYSWQFFFEGVANLNQEQPYLYAMRGNPIRGVYLHKVSLANSDFGTDASGNSKKMDENLYFPGQSAKHEGAWVLPDGPINGIQQLDFIADGALSSDTFSGITDTSVPTNGSGDHFDNLDGQLVGYTREGKLAGLGFGGAPAGSDGGARILKPFGDANLDADWGSAFPCGDVSERATGLSGLDGATWVMKKDGLYSFNKLAQSRLILEDYKRWPSSLDNNPVRAWKGGLMIPHASGLLHFTPGQLPVDASVGRHLGSRQLPPSGVTEFHSGAYHSAYPIGDYAYAMYQPDPSSTTAYVLVAYGDPADPVWQSLGSVTLLSTRVMSDLFVSTLGRPTSANFVTPTLWVGDAGALKYMVLDQKASPFRARSDVHGVQQSATAYMSELIFSEPTQLDELVVHTQDLASADEFQLSLIVNGTGDEVNLGAPVRGDGRHSLTLRNYGRVNRLTLGVSFSTTNAGDRVPPSIALMELYADLA